MSLRTHHKCKCASVTHADTHTRGKRKRNSSSSSTLCRISTATRCKPKYRPSALPFSHFSFIFSLPSSLLGNVFRLENLCYANLSTFIFIKARQGNSQSSLNPFSFPFFPLFFCCFSSDSPLWIFVSYLDSKAKSLLPIHPPGCS